MNGQPFKDIQEDGKAAIEWLELNWAKPSDPLSGCAMDVVRYAKALEARSAGTCEHCKHWFRFKPHDANLGTCGVVVETIAPKTKPDAMVISVGFPQENNFVLYRSTYGCNQFEAKE